MCIRLRNVSASPHFYPKPPKTRRYPQFWHPCALLLEKGVITFFRNVDPYSGAIKVRSTCDTRLCACICETQFLNTSFQTPSSSILSFHKKNFRGLDICERFFSKIKLIKNVNKRSSLSDTLLSSLMRNSFSKISIDIPTPSGNVETLQTIQNIKLIYKLNVLFPLVPRLFLYNIL